MDVVWLEEGVDLLRRRSQGIAKHKFAAVVSKSRCPVRINVPHSSSISAFAISGKLFL